jgi:hypothetical protein
MIFDENEISKHQQYSEAVTAYSQRLDVFELLMTAQHMGIMMSFHRHFNDETQEWSEFMDWSVLPGFEHAPAIVWMYSNDTYAKIYRWQKLCWHMCQENQPFSDEEPDELPS